MRETFVVAYLYNTNGMATWCWEAAHALQETGAKVLLVASDDVSMQESPTVEILRFRQKSEQVLRPSNWLLRKINRVRDLIGLNSNSMLKELNAELDLRGFGPRVFLLNDSSLVDPSIIYAQFVTAWAFPTGLWSYLKKTGTLSASSKSLFSCFTIALSLIGYWRRDWFAYKKSKCVLAVTERLASELRSAGIPTSVVYPGTRLPASVAKSKKAASHTIRILIAAENLAEPRKRVGWMLDAFAKWKPAKPVELILVGNGGAAIEELSGRLAFPVHSLGKLRRDQLQATMADIDLFCFGSVLDDWGYVLVEALSHGMIALAPKQTPFDEIMGESEFLYHPGDQRDFIQKLQLALECDLAVLRDQNLSRIQQLFSRKAFGERLLLAAAAGHP